MNQSLSPATADTPAEALHIVDVRGNALAVPAERLWAFENGRYYELSVEYWLDRMMATSDAPVLYDIGANIGYYGVRYAETAAHVYAFEPVASTYEVLDGNVRRNGLDNVTPVRSALSDEEGEATINLWSSSGSNTLYDRAIPHEALGTETIRLTRLDDLVAAEDFLPPSVMKIDIEGAELPALRGARALIERHRPHLLVECVAAACEDAGYRQEELFDELRHHGYELRGLSPIASDVRLHAIETAMFSIENVVAFPPGSPLLESPTLTEVTGDEVRSFVTVAALDELLEAPELLVEYARAFGADDDATLVIHGNGDRIAELATLVERLCLDGPDTPDMLALVHGMALIAAPLRRAADAVLSGRPARAGWALCPHFAGADIEELRALALSKEPAPAPAAPSFKEQSELAYWSGRKATEGALFNDHYEFIYTEHFGLDAAFFAGKRLLDVGCGPRGSLEWAHGAAERVGLDPLAKSYLELGAAEHAMDYVASGAESIPFAEGHFDVVMTINSLDHVDNLDATIAELTRVLRPGGTLLLITDVNHDPTPCEPHDISWDIVDAFTPALRVVDERHLEKDDGSMLTSLQQPRPYDHTIADRRYGILSVRFVKDGAAG